MKRSIYQKLLLSFAIAAFFVALASAQVMNRNQVSTELIEMKKKAKAQGLDAVPAEWIEDAKQARTERIKNERIATAKPRQATAKKAVEKSTLKKEKINTLSLRQQAQLITPPPGFKVVIKNVGGKDYIEFVELPDGQGTIPVKAKN